MNAVKTEKTTLERLISWTVRGGWPGAIDLDISSAAQIPKSYLQSIIEDDIRQIDGVNRDSKKLTMLLRSLARNVSTIVSIKTLVNDIAEDFGETIHEDTVADYLNALQRLFIIEDQRAFNPNMRSSVRVGKSSKRHFVDPSLAVAALGATPERLLNDLRTFGFLFESLCIRDLRIYAEAIDGQLFHYRDATGREIDAVIELPDGTWGAFEIKLGANQIDDAAKHLLSIKKLMQEDPKAKAPSVLCVVCGLLDFSYTREDGVMVVPIHALK